MKKLLILIIILSCMGCISDMWEMECYVVNDGIIASTYVVIEPCGFLQEWDKYTCDCEWLF